MENKKIKTIALIAPSGNIKDIELVENNIDILKKNFKVKKYYSEKARTGYVSDSPENRINYFENAFLDDEVDLVISVRGGFGALQVVDNINWDLIKNSNKFYLASSDATILLCALYKKTNVKCFHSLMITNGFVENLKNNIDIVENNLFKIKLEPIKKGNLKGILWGGNLSSLVSLFSGNSYLPDEDIILFLEDLNEPMYKLDKMMMEIFRYKKLKSKIKGIIFGDFYFERKEIMPLFKKYTELFNVATYITDDITHKKNNITLPFGKKLDILPDKLI